MANRFNPNGQYLAEVDFGIKVNVNYDANQVIQATKNKVDTIEKLVQQSVQQEVKNPTSATTFERQLRELFARFDKQVEKRAVHAIQAYNAAGNIFENGQYGHVAVSQVIKGVGDALSRALNNQVKFGVNSAQEIVDAINKIKPSNVNRAELKTLADTHLISASRALNQVITKRREESAKAIAELAKLDQKLADDLAETGLTVANVKQIQNKVAQRAELLKKAADIEKNPKQQQEAAKVQAEINKLRADVDKTVKARARQQTREKDYKDLRKQIYTALNLPGIDPFAEVAAIQQKRLDEFKKFAKDNVAKNALRKDPSTVTGYRLATTSTGALNAAAQKLQAEWERLDKAYQESLGAEQRLRRLDSLEVKALEIFQTEVSKANAFTKALNRAEQRKARLFARAERLKTQAKALALDKTEQQGLEIFNKVAPKRESLATIPARNDAQIRLLEAQEKDLKGLVDTLYTKVFGGMTGDLAKFNSKLRAGIRVLLSDRSSADQKNRTLEFLIQHIATNLNQIEGSADEVVQRFANKLVGFREYLHDVKSKPGKLATLPKEAQDLYATFGAYNNNSNTYGADARLGFKGAVQAPFKDARLANDKAANSAAQLVRYQIEQSVNAAETIFANLGASSSVADLRKAAKDLLDIKEGSFKALAKNLLDAAQTLEDLPQDASLAELTKARAAIAKARTVNRTDIVGLPGDLGTRVASANSGAYGKSLADLDAVIGPKRDQLFNELSALYQFAETKEKEVVAGTTKAEDALQQFAKEALKVAQSLATVDYNVSTRVNAVATAASNYTGSGSPKQQQEAKNLLNELVRSTGLSVPQVRSLLTTFDAGTSALDRTEQTQQVAFKDKNTANQKAQATAAAKRAADYTEAIDKYLNSIADFSQAHPIKDNAQTQADLQRINNHLQSIDKNHKIVTLDDLNARGEERVRGALTDNKRKTEIDDLGGLAASFGLEKNLKNLELIADSGIYAASQRIKRFGYQVFTETFSNLTSVIAFQLGQMLGDAYRKAQEIEGVVSDLSSVTVTETGIVQKSDEVTAAQGRLRNALAASGAVFKNGTQAAIEYSRGLYDLSYSTDRIATNLDTLSKLAKIAKRDLGDLTKLALPIDKLYGINNTEVGASLLATAVENNVSAEQSSQNFLKLAGNKDIRAALSPKEMIAYAVAAAKMGREVEDSLTGVLNSIEELNSKGQLDLKDSDLGKIKDSLFVSTEALKALSVQFNEFLSNVQKSGISTVFTGLAFALHTAIVPLELLAKWMAGLMNSPAKPYLEGIAALVGAGLGFFALRKAVLSVIPALDLQVKKYNEVRAAATGAAVAGSAGAISVIRAVGPLSTALLWLTKIMSGWFGVFVMIGSAAYSMFQAWKANEQAAKDLGEEGDKALSNIQEKLDILAKTRSIRLGIEIDSKDPQFLADLAAGNLAYDGTLSGIDTVELDNLIKANKDFLTEDQKKTVLAISSNMGIARNAAEGIKNSLGNVSSILSANGGPFTQLSANLTAAALAAKDMQVALNNLEGPGSKQAIALLSGPINQFNRAAVQANLEVQLENAQYANSDLRVNLSDRIRDNGVAINNAELGQTEAGNEVTWVEAARDDLRKQYEKITNPTKADRELFEKRDRELFEQRKAALERENEQIKEINRLRAYQHTLEQEKYELDKNTLLRQKQVYSDLSKQLTDVTLKEIQDTLIGMGGLQATEIEEILGMTATQMANFLSNKSKALDESIAGLAKPTRSRPLELKKVGAEYDGTDYTIKRQSQAEQINGDEIVKNIMGVLQNYADANRVLVDSPEAVAIRQTIEELERTMANPDGVTWAQGKFQSLEQIKNLVDSYQGLLDLIHDTNKTIANLRFVGLDKSNPTERLAAQLESLGSGITRIREATQKFMSQNITDPARFSSIAGSMEAQVNTIINVVKSNVENLTNRILSMSQDYDSRIESTKDGIELRRLKAKYTAGITDPYKRAIAERQAEIEMEEKRERREMARIQEQIDMQKQFVQDIRDSVTEWKLAIDRNTDALNGKPGNAQYTPNPAPNSTVPSLPVPGVGQTPLAATPNKQVKPLKDKTEEATTTPSGNTPIVVVTPAPVTTTTTTGPLPPTAGNGGRGSGSNTTINNTTNNVTNNVTNNNTTINNPAQPATPSQPNQPAQPATPAQPSTQPRPSTVPAPQPQTTPNPMPNTPGKPVPVTFPTPVPVKPEKEEDEDKGNGDESGKGKPAEKPQEIPIPLPITAPVPIPVTFPVPEEAPLPKPAPAPVPGTIPFPGFIPGQQDEELPAAAMSRAYASMEAALIRVSSSVQSATAKFTESVTGSMNTVGNTFTNFTTALGRIKLPELNGKINVNAEIPATITLTVPEGISNKLTIKYPNGISDKLTLKYPEGMSNDLTLKVPKNLPSLPVAFEGVATSISNGIKSAMRVLDIATLRVVEITTPKLAVANMSTVNLTEGTGPRPSTSSTGGTSTPTPTRTPPQTQLEPPASGVKKALNYFSSKGSTIVENGKTRLKGTINPTNGTRAINGMGNAIGALSLIDVVTQFLDPNMLGTRVLRDLQSDAISERPTGYDRSSGNVRDVRLYVAPSPSQQIDPIKKKVTFLLYAEVDGGKDKKVDWKLKDKDGDVTLQANFRGDNNTALVTIKQPGGTATVVASKGGKSAAMPLEAAMQGRQFANDPSDAIIPAIGGGVVSNAWPVYNPSNSADKTQMPVKDAAYWANAVNNGTAKMSAVPKELQNDVAYRIANSRNMIGVGAHGSPTATGIMESKEIWPGLTPGSFSRAWTHAGWAAYAAQDNPTIIGYRDSGAIKQAGATEETKGAVAFNMAFPKDAMRTFDRNDWENFTIDYAAKKLGINFSSNNLAPKSSDYLSAKDQKTGGYTLDGRSAAQARAYTLDFISKHGLDVENPNYMKQTIPNLNMPGTFVTDQRRTIKEMNPTPQQIENYLKQYVFSGSKTEFAEEFRLRMLRNHPIAQQLLQALSGPTGVTELGQEAAKAYADKAVSEGVKVWKYTASNFGAPDHYGIIDPSVISDIKWYDPETQQVPKGFAPALGTYNNSVNFASPEIRKLFVERWNNVTIGNTRLKLTTPNPTTATPRTTQAMPRINTNTISSIARTVGGVADQLGVVGEVVGGVADRVTGQVPAGINLNPWKSALGMTKPTQVALISQKHFLNKSDTHTSFVNQVMLKDQAGKPFPADFTAKLTYGRANVTISNKDNVGTLTVKLPAGVKKAIVLVKSKKYGTSRSFTFHDKAIIPAVGGGIPMSKFQTIGDPLTIDYRMSDQGLGREVRDQAFQGFGKDVTTTLDAGIRYDTIYDSRGNRVLPDSVLNGNLPEQHMGTDIVVSDGRVKNPFYGAVVKSVNAGAGKDGIHGNEDDGAGDGFGKKLVLQLADGFEMLLAHFDSIAVKQGDKLDVGAFLGMQGSTGTVTGDHAHTQLMKNGATVISQEMVEAIIKNLITYMAPKEAPTELPTTEQVASTLPTLNAVITDYVGPMPVIVMNPEEVRGTVEPEVVGEVGPVSTVIGAVTEAVTGAVNSVVRAAGEAISASPARTTEEPMTPVEARGAIAVGGQTVEMVNPTVRMEQSDITFVPARGAKEDPIKVATDNQTFSVKPTTLTPYTGGLLMREGSKEALTEYLGDLAYLTDANATNGDKRSTLTGYQRQDAVEEQVYALIDAIRKNLEQFTSSLKGILQSGITRLLSIPQEYFRRVQARNESVKQLTFQGASIEAQRASVQASVSELQSKVSKAKTLEEYNGYIQQLQQVEGQLREINTQYAVWQEGMRQTKEQGLKFGEFFVDLFEDLGNQVANLFNERAGNYLMAALFNEYDVRGLLGGSIKDMNHLRSIEGGSTNPNVPLFGVSSNATGLVTDGTDTGFGARYRTDAVTGLLTTLTEQGEAMVEGQAIQTEVTKSGFAASLGAALTAIAVQMVISTAINIFRAAMTKRESDSKKFTAPLDFDTTRGTSNPSGVKQVVVNTTVNGATASDVSRIASNEVDKGMNRLRFGV